MVNVTYLDKKRTVTRTETVIERLREMVLDGRYGPGTHLQETRFAKELGVSRTPVRDALRALGQEGLLTYSPNRGYFVAELTNEDILDAYEVRSSLEGMACRLCVEKGAGTTLLETLETILAACAEIFSGERDGSEWGVLNTRFHLAIVEGTRNKALLSAAKQMRRIPRAFDNRLHPQTSFFKSVYTQDRRLRSHEEHVAIYEAIKSGQGSRAAFLMREHVYRNRAVLEAKFRAEKQVLRSEAEPA